MEAPKHGFPQDPTSPSSSSSSSSSSSNPTRTHLPPPPPPPPPASPKPIPRTIESAPYPTTFVQADTASFKQVVQMLTGAAGAEASARPAKNGGGGNGSLAAPCRPATAPKKPAFKLYERRSSLKNLKMISPLPVATAAASPRKAAPPEILSPSVLDFPSLALSPVTPLIPDPFNRSPAAAAAPASTEEAERAAIAEKGFFLHPSPRGAERPRLLPLFPVTSPRMASATPSSERGLRI